MVLLSSFHIQNSSHLSRKLSVNSFAFNSLSGYCSLMALTIVLPIPCFRKDGFTDIQHEGILQLVNMIEHESYLYLECNCSPAKSPNQIVTALKRASFQRLLQMKDDLNSFWARPFMLSTQTISEEHIEEFLKTLKSRG